MKKCSRCKVEKSKDQFSIRNASRDGYEAACILCVRRKYHEPATHDKKLVYSKEYYQRHKLDILAKQTEIRKKTSKNAHLTKKIVEEIFLSNLPKKEIAKVYSLNVDVIKNIKNLLTYTQYTMPLLEEHPEKYYEPKVFKYEKM